MTSCEDDICSICHTLLGADSPDIYSVPECGHRFHSNCIIPWFRVSNGSCPYCRANIIGARYSPNDIKQVVQLWKFLSRRRDCPTVVKKKCKQIKLAKEEERKSVKELTKLKEEHREAISKWRSLRRKRWYFHTKVRMLERQLAFLPPMPILRYLMPISVRK